MTPSQKNIQEVMKVFEKKDLGSSKSYFLAAGKAAGWDTDLRNKDPIDKDDNSQNRFVPFLIVVYRRIAKFLWIGSRFVSLNL